MTEEYLRDTVQQARHGDENAFRVLYEECAEVVYALALRMLGERTDAQDALQAVFISAHERLSTFRGEAAVCSWLCSIAYHHCVDMLRKRDRRARYHAPYQGHVVDRNGRMLHASSSSAESDVAREQFLRLVERGLDKMHPDLSLTFLLHDRYGMSYRDVSNALSCSIGTVGSRLSRARKQMAEFLRSMGVDESYFETN